MRECVAFLDGIAVTVAVARLEEAPRILAAHSPIR
jgi:hypothetical protein